jgi:hypothetical protein
VTREWKFAHYGLADATDDVARNLLGCVRSCFRGIESLDNERGAAERRVAERTGSPCD